MTKRAARHLFAIGVGVGVASLGGCSLLTDVSGLSQPTADADAARSLDANVDRDATIPNVPDGGKPTSFLVWAGGANSTAAGSGPSAEILIARVNDDGSLAEWKRGPDLPLALYRHSVVSVDGHVYVLGGGDSPQTAASSHVFDVALTADGTATVTTAASALPLDISDACAASANGRIYAKDYAGTRLAFAQVSGGKLGGWKMSALTSDVELYGAAAAGPTGIYVTGATAKSMRRLPLGATFEPTETVWQAASDAPRVANISIAQSPLVSHGGFLYLVGTFADTGEQEARVFGSPLAGGASLTWQEMEPFVGLRHAHSAAAVSGFLYVAGGYGSNGEKDVAYAAILPGGRLGLWQGTTPMPSGRVGTCQLAAVTVP